MKKAQRSVLTCVNLPFRSLEAMSSCPSGRSTVVTLRCNPEKSTRGDLSVPRYHRPDLMMAVRSCSTQWPSGPVRMLRILWVVLARRKCSKRFFSFSFLCSSNCPRVRLLLCTLAWEGCKLLLRGSNEGHRAALKPDYLINMQDSVLAPAVNLLFHPAV